MRSDESRVLLSSIAQFSRFPLDSRRKAGTFQKNWMTSVRHELSIVSEVKENDKIKRLAWEIRDGTVQ